MSVAYDGGEYAPPRRVNYGWIGESWGLLGQEASPWIVSQIIYGVISFVASLAVTFSFSMIASSFFSVHSPAGGSSSGGAFSGWWSGGGSSSSAVNIVNYACSVGINIFQSSAFSRMAVKQVRGEPITWSDAFSGGPAFWRIAGVFALAGLLGLCGLLGFVIGIFFVAGLLLPAAAMAADGESAMAAVARSLGAMKRDWVSAGLFCILFGGLTLVSMIPCGLGLLATTPMLYLISALAYRDMVGMPRSNASAMQYGTASSGVWPPPPSVTRPPEGPYWGAE